MAPDSLAPEARRTRLLIPRKVTRRIKRAASAIAFPLGLALLAAPLACRCLTWPRTSDWGLPSDLLAHDVRELALPTNVDRVDCLPRNLEILDVSHSAVTDLSHLPSGLRELNASYTPVRDLATLPSGLQDLDVQTTDLKALDHLPAGLVRLSLGSTRITSIKALPPRLEELFIHGAILADLPPLPATLRVLRLEGPTIDSLEGLPQSLRSLTLSGTRITSLKGLPPALERLEIQHNVKLPAPPEIDFLPTYLRTLIFDQPTIPPKLKDLPLLTVLDAKLATPIDGSPLPLSLTTLRVRDLPITLKQFPPDLRTLGLIGPKLRSLKDLHLPSTIRSLELDSCLNDTLDFSAYPLLQQITLPFSRVEHLANLPGGLLALDLSGTPLRELPPLPATLRVLRLRSTQLTTLPALPDELRVLDLDGSDEITALPALSEKLQLLLIGGTSIAGLPKLPIHLRVLDIASTKIKDFTSIVGGLPQGLEELRLAPGQISALGKLPPRLRSLKFPRREP